MYSLSGIVAWSCSTTDWQSIALGFAEFVKIRKCLETRIQVIFALATAIVLLILNIGNLT